MGEHDRSSRPAQHGATGECVLANGVALAPRPSDSVGAVPDMVQRAIGDRARNLAVAHPAVEQLPAKMDRAAAWIVDRPLRSHGSIVPGVARSPRASSTGPPDPNFCSDLCA